MFHRRPSPQRAALTVLLSVALLCLLFVPTPDGESRRLVFDWRPELEPLLLMAALALLALAGRRLPSALRWIVALFVVAAAALQLAGSLVPVFLDRDLDLYFDLPQVPRLIALFFDAAGPWQGSAAVAAAALAGLGVVALVARALAESEHALKPQRHAAVCLGVVVASLLVAPVAGLEAGEAPLAEHTLPMLGDQAARLYRGIAASHGYDRRYAAALASPQPAPTALPGLKRRDVYIVFVESYGTLVLDDPRFAASVLPALDDFARIVHQAGYHLTSSRIVSPTYGGGSWLAHGTIDSGMRLDAMLCRLITTTTRLTLPRYLAASGYRTVDVAPGIKAPDPTHDFWGFDRSYYADDLGYHGPRFGWFDIPDQYTLRRFDETEAAPGHQPLFAQIVLVSSHVPFAPVPPYMPGWGGADLYQGIAQADWDRILAPPDWTHLDRPYAESVVYDLKTLAGWLARREGDGLIVILGDHQPPGMAADAAEPWTVPIHVLSRDPALVEPFIAQGYVEGAVPPREGRFRGMETFLGDFLSAYAQPPAVAATGLETREHSPE